ncbi:MAG: class I SAM-dependent methyltransferase [Anaerolineae bacterium]
MYDAFSADYDHFVNWEERLAAELPFLEERLREAGAHRVLDAACGTGMHALALARHGYHVVGADLSEGMIERARAHAREVGAEVRFTVAGFGELGAKVGEEFDAVLCLGNSLPHVLTREGLRDALGDFATCLRPGGLFLVQNLNYDRVLALREPWLPLQTHREGREEWLFLRHYDFEPAGTLTFHVVTLHRSKGGEWHRRTLATRLRPLPKAELAGELQRAGFGEIETWGDMGGSAFEPAASPNLIVTARRVAPRQREQLCASWQ